MSAGEYYDNSTSTWVVDSYVYTMDLTLTANLAWRKVRIETAASWFGC